MSLLCTTLSLVLGLYFSRNNLILSIVISVAYLIFLFVRFNKKTFFIGLSLFAIGITISNINLEYNSKNNQYSGFVVEVKDNYYLFQSKTEKFYVYEKENSHEIGDYLVIEDIPIDLKITTYESQFDFKEYLNNKGVKRQLKSNIIDIKFSSFIKIHAFKKKFLSRFDDNTKALIEAFLFNEKDYSSYAIKLTSEMKITSLFSLSGIYLHFIFGALTYILALKFENKTSEILPFFILLPYAFFSFSKIGTLRVYALYLLKYFNKYKFKKKLTHIELVSILALIFITFDYHLVYQEAFYIGFLLSILIPFAQNAFKFINKKKRKILLSSFIQLCILPITLTNHSFNPFYLLFIPLLVIPNTFFLLVSIASTVIPFYKFVNKCGGILTWILEKISIANLAIPIADLGGTFTIIYLLLLLIGIFYLEAKRMKSFKVITCLIMLEMLVAIVPIQDPLINGVYFINVGQGDSILIKNRTHTVLIDTGGATKCDMATETLIPFFNKIKVTHLDALITTHDDFDHNGAADSLLNNFKVYNYLTTKDDFPYSVGDINLINLNNSSGGEDNDKSLVLSLNFMNKKFLFMGDASTKVEKNLIKQGYDLDCDILKIGHHGSKSSTSEEFIKATSPSTAIISVGGNNYYGHPTNEVLNLLNKYDIKIRRTDIEGTISYLSLIA